ncbi:helix-turn-helix domain-containing protein [Streptomyces werraensis]|uniref:helix-turn-helix domain-containing protein n=1 Tax=Streptomyces werraensis TaxID=68284 RepID=UPI001CE297A9
MATATAYLAHFGNLSRTARSFQVHRNTLLKCVQRIAGLLEENWRSPDSVSA